jgi:hypothetical protein
MSKEEFKKQFEEYFAWASDQDRKESNWWLSVQNFAEAKFNEAYKKDYPNR